MNQRQIKALRALCQPSSHLAQYPDSAGWYVWSAKDNGEYTPLEINKVRLSLTCKDVNDLINEGHLVSQHHPPLRFITDKGREFVESLRITEYV